MMALLKSLERDAYCDFYCRRIKPYDRFRYIYRYTH
nr:hypothetical protein [Staphylococcus sp. 8AQ]